MRTRPTLTRRTRTAAVVLGAALAVGAVDLALAAPAQAHEKWFLDDPGSYATDWSFALSPLVLVLLTAVVAVTLAWRAVAVRALPMPELAVLRPLGRLVPYVPRLLALHLGVSLLALAVGGHFLAHDLVLPSTTTGGALALVEGALGVWFITGVRLRVPAAGLAVVGLCALLLTGPVGLLSAAGLLGIAVFLVVLPPSDEAFGRVELSETATRRALLALRVGVAVALVSLAFAEKLANPDMARATLAAHPQLDVFALVGLDVSPDVFIAVAGATEVLFGLLVLSGALPQLAVLVALVPFNATLLLFGQTELLGHLPVYGVFLTLLVYGSHPTTSAWVRALPGRRHATAASDPGLLAPSAA